MTCDTMFADLVVYQYKCKDWTYEKISAQYPNLCSAPPVGFVGASTMTEMCPETCSNRNASLFMIIVLNYSINHTFLFDTESLIPSAARAEDPSFSRCARVLGQQKGRKDFEDHDGWTGDGQKITRF